MYKVLLENKRVNVASLFVEEFVKFCNERETYPGGGALIDDEFGFPYAQCVYID